MAELDGLLEEEKKGSREANLVLEASPSSAQETVTELEEEKTAQSRMFEAFHEEQADLNQLMLNVFNESLKIISFKNVVG